jgi:hypothetical protein
LPFDSVAIAGSGSNKGRRASVAVIVEAETQFTVITYAEPKHKMIYLLHFDLEMQNILHLMIKKIFSTYFQLLHDNTMSRAEISDLQ